MRNPINHNKLLLQISLFLGIAHYLINMYLCSHKLRVIFLFCVVMLGLKNVNLGNLSL